MFSDYSRSIIPSLIIGALIIVIGLTYSFGRDFGQIVGGWGENFGETMGTWGENIGRTFSNWGSGFGNNFGASILIIIGIMIVTNQLRARSRVS
jgi:putative Mn2+ efflux pump MntP